VIKIKQASEWMSATKIATYAGDFGCPRKFYYQYIAKLPSKPSIYFPLGNIPHKTLELFFKLNLFKQDDMETAILKTHDDVWSKHKVELKTFNLTPQEVQDYYQESRRMVLNWLHSFLKEEPKDMMPWIEQNIWVHDLKLMCRVDRAKKGKNPGVFHIIDYKTSKSNKIWKDTELLLVLQWICYHKQTGNTRHKVGVHYLKYPDDPKFWAPTQAQIDWALQKVDFVRKNTRSTDINDYPCTCGGKCLKDFIIENGPSNQIHTPENKTEAETRSQT